ncbi:MAG: hypothetical protein QGI21_07275 [Candidatus Poseidoniaceae archaeon]|nr:hypothetical protein [Candidatus Poseidoniaceae archaeon]
MKENLPVVTRQRMVARMPEFGMLTKPWKSIVLIALNEIQVPSDDEDENNPPQHSIGSRRRSRTRRGGRSGSGPMEWLPEATDVLIDDGTSSAFRLAVLLIRKTLFPDNWEDNWDDIIASLREQTTSDGVHPVWGKIAVATPILAQFAAFPKSEVEEELEDKFDLKSGWIDPSNAKELASTLEKLESNTSDAIVRASIQKARAQLKGKRGLRDIQNLESLEGEASLISSLVLIHLGKDASNSLKELGKIDAKLSSALIDLVTLRSGKMTNWKKVRSLDDSSGLSTARRKAAWALMPDSSSNLSSSELRIGIESINDSQQKDKATWWLLSSLVKEKKVDEATSVLNSLEIESNTEITDLLPLLRKLGEEATNWLNNQLSKLSEKSLSQIVDDNKISIAVRLNAARKLIDSGSEIGLESSVELFTKGLDFNRLADLLLTEPNRPGKFPYETLLVTHLLPAKSKGMDFQELRVARKNALSTIESMKGSDAFSDVSRGLIMMLDGAPLSDDKWVITKLNKSGLKAFNNCRQALREGGDGLANPKVIDDLADSVDDADLTEIEARLFNAVIDTLHLNRASLLLQNGQKSGVEELLNGLLSDEETAMPMIQAVRHLVLEYDIGLPNLVSWYQQNEPLSPWHTLARAAVHSSNGSELNAARDYRKAGDHPDFDYEHQIILYRKALIHLAHSRQWSEAVELLDSQQALKTAVTRRFQLYLRVSNSAADVKRTDEATRMLKNFVKRTKIVDQEDQYGEIKQVSRIQHSEEELDLLRNYPHSHSRPLPSEPFGGRVKAALNSLQREKRRTRHTFENRYAIAMQFDPISLEDIYEIAHEAAAKNPQEGLMLLERAQNSSKFDSRDKKRLARAEKGLFSTHKHNLVVRQRAYLRNLDLKPLVIVDTNILIDELQHRISEGMGISTESSLDIVGYGQFHRMLKKRSEEGKIHLWLPKVVRDELQMIATDVERMRSRFDDTHISSVVLDKLLTKDNLHNIANGIVSDFSNWSPLDLHLEDETNDEELRDELKRFLLDHYEVYEEITAMKRLSGEPLRGVINGKDVYPEVPDQTLMCLASILANQPLTEIGSILVATRDSDFALVARAVEERFGFGVIANSRNLNTWLK